LGVPLAGRAIRYIFCFAKAPQKDAAPIPHAGGTTCIFGSNNVALREDVEREGVMWSGMTGLL
jgi:hypothetical protein